MSICSSFKFHHFESNNLLIVMSSNLLRICLFGLPPDIVYGSTSFTTTDPAAITAPVPILTPERIIVFPPIHTSCPISISPLDLL